MKLKWYSLAGEKREWFDGMVELTFSINDNETASIICDESVKNEALLAIAVIALKNLTENLQYLETGWKEKLNGKNGYE
jgi:hypothetical protein